MSGPGGSAGPRSRAVAGRVAARAAGSRVARRAALGAVLAALLGAGCGHIVVLHDPLSAAEHNDLGVAYQAQGQLDLAAREYRRAARRDRHFARAWLNLGNVAAARERWQAAARLYRRALHEDRRSADAMNNLAFALLRTRDGNLDEAETLARAAVAADGERDSLYRSTLEEVRRARGEKPRP